VWEQLRAGVFHAHAARTATVRLFLPRESHI
jgi:hypothetical protein